MTVNDVLQTALQLPPGDRARIARDLIHSLDQFDDEDQVAWFDEIEARAASVAEGDFTAIPRRESVEALRKDLTERRNQQ